MTRLWTINGRFLTQPLTGVQRYARETIAALDRLIDAGIRCRVVLLLSWYVRPGRKTISFS